MRHSLLLAAALLLVTTVASAQSAIWLPTTGPYGAMVYGVVADAGGALLASTANGLYRSTDDGMRWEFFGVAPHLSHIRRTAGGDLIAIVEADLVRSTDDGATWSTRASASLRFTDLAVSSGGVYYAVAYDHVYRSTDEGESWTFDRIDASNLTHVFGLADDTVLAVESNAVYRSDDSGATWLRTPLDFSIADVVRDPGGALVAVSNENGAAVIRMSIDTGASWFELTDGLHGVTVGSLATTGDGSVIASTSAGIARLRGPATGWGMISPFNPYLYDADFVAPTEGVLFAMMQSGLQRSTDDGATWTWANDGMPPSSPSGIAIAPTGEVYAGGPGAPHRSTDMGATWERMPVFGVASTPFVTPSGAVLASTVDGVARSTDRGATWSDIRIASNAHLFEFAAAPDGTIYGLGYNRHFVRSDDDGLTWTSPSPMLDSMAALTTIIVSPDGTITVGGNSLKLLRSSDRGESWRILSSPFAGVAVSSAVLPNGDVLVGMMGRVLRIRPDDAIAQFGLHTFSNIADLLVVDSTIYAGSAAGVYRWTLGVDAEWQPFTSGLPTPARLVLDIAAHPSGHLFAAVSRGGVQRTSMAISAGADDERRMRAVLTVTPQLSSSTLAVAVTLERPSSITTTLRSITGEAIARRDHGPLGAGDHRLALPLDGIASGVYLCEVRIGGERAVARVVIAR
jgi:photosystem II stability/assembly factor-like uncharacterized protein